MIRRMPMPWEKGYDDAHAGIDADTDDTHGRHAQPTAPHVLDARSRAAHTFLGGLAIDCTIALGGVLGGIGDFDLQHKAGWVTLAVLISKTVLQTAGSYLVRMNYTPSHQLAD